MSEGVCWQSHPLGGCTGRYRKTDDGRTTSRPLNAHVVTATPHTPESLVECTECQGLRRAGAAARDEAGAHPLCLVTTHNNRLSFDKVLFVS